MAIAKVPSVSPPALAVLNIIHTLQRAVLNNRLSLGYPRVCTHGCACLGKVKINSKQTTKMLLSKDLSLAPKRKTDFGDKGRQPSL